MDTPLTPLQLLVHTPAQSSAGSSMNEKRFHRKIGLQNVLFAAKIMHASYIPNC